MLSFHSALFGIGWNDIELMKTLKRREIMMRVLLKIMQISVSFVLCFFVVVVVVERFRGLV